MRSHLEYQYLILGKRWVAGAPPWTRLRELIELPTPSAGGKWACHFSPKLSPLAMADDGCQPVANLKYATACRFLIHVCKICIRPRVLGADHLSLSSCIFASHCWQLYLNVII